MAKKYNKMPPMPPDTQAIALDMTPERKQRFQESCSAIIDFMSTLRLEPLERMVVLHMVLDAYHELTGIDYKGTIMLGPGPGPEGSDS
jgi:hypothetical protein